jgi:lipopolysaccharide/colanic/teichoic acid biosynthesis glycosyltransferase/glycosyltransferase involved in cell wall biosynthesis
MRVVLIHQAFVAPDEAGGTRHYELAKRAIEQGIDFTIVASDISYLTGRHVGDDEQRIGEQNFAGLRVLRAYTYPSLHRSFAWRVVSFLTFMLTSIRAAWRAGRVDLVMGTSPPIFQALSAWLVARLRRRPWLLEIRDLWPEFAIDLGVLRNPALIRLSRRLERFLYARAAHLLVNSPAYRDYLIGRGVPPDKITLIANGVDASRFDPEARAARLREAHGLADKFVVTYAGALGLANDIDTILRAAARLDGTAPVHFLLVGDGKERARLESSARRLNVTNVTFVGARPTSEMPEWLAASDACVATLKDIPMFRTTYPNKVFDYMAAGRPVVLAIDGCIRRVVEAAGGGVFVPPGDDRALAEAVLALRDDRGLTAEMGRRARAYVVEHFDRRQQADDFAALLRRLAASRQRRFGMLSYRGAGKRLLDLSLALPALAVLSPLILLLALLVRAKLGSPILFRQRRPGVNGAAFTIWKFRTMTEARDAGGHRLPDAERLTRFGRFLRAASLDELPELFMVLKGDMSLVGPRPLLMEYLDRYTPEQARRHEVKPGLTGWAQINGRNAVAWEDRFKLDTWYVDRVSLWLDLKIIGLTLVRLARRQGISAEGHATMPLFLGSEREDR